MFLKELVTKIERFLGRSKGKPEKGGRGRRKDGGKGRKGRRRKGEKHANRA